MSPFPGVDIKRNERERKRKLQDDNESSSFTKRRLKDRPKAKDTISTPPNALEESPFYEQTYSLFLPLSPISYQHPLQGLCAEHLSPLILVYYPPFHGVVLSYRNTRLSAEPPKDPNIEISAPVLAKSVDEYAVSFVWITADFLIFRPRKHNPIEGWVNLQNKGNLGLVYLNFFNVSIEGRRLPKAWTWVPEGIARQGMRRLGLESDRKGEEHEGQHDGDTAGAGYFIDGDGEKVEGLVRLRVTNVETSRSAGQENGFIIEGTMLSDKEEKELREQETTESPRL